MERKKHSDTAADDPGFSPKIRKSSDKEPTRRVLFEKSPKHYLKNLNDKNGKSIIM